MPELTNLEKIRRLPWQLVGNAFNTIFWYTAAAGSVVILFFNELGFDKVKIGFLVALLPFCGLTAIFTAPVIERFGFKRMFLTFYGLRNFSIALLLLIPFILPQFTFTWVATAILLFSLCRALGETAMYPWAQEMIPDSIRGKYSAITNVVCQLLNIATVTAAGYVIGRYAGINKFVVIIACGVAAGLVTLWCFTFVPGGAPVRTSGTSGTHFKDMLDSLHNRNYRRFMAGLCLLNIPVNSLIAFVPLYMKEQVGISPGMVVWLDIGMFAGGMLSSFLWGWASDRYGSKPIMLFGACTFMLYPLLCFLMPRYSAASVPMALVTTFLMGVSNLAWTIGWARYLFVSAVPSRKKTAYMAVFYAGIGLASGLGPLLAGMLLNASAAINGKFLVFTIDSYTPLFALSLLALGASVFFLSKVRADGAMPVRKFVGMFFQGNPLVAVGSLVRYRLARDEEARVSITERMGYAANPLSNNELIEALNDPSFNVRYEAIVAIAHSRPDPNLVDALLLILGGNEPDLSVHAAWALGRLGDKSAIIALRETLESEHPLLRARSARALASLNDIYSIPRLLHYFRTETKAGLRIAYAQALGKMRFAAVIDEMLDFLASLDDVSLRDEMALAIGRIVGNEKEYISLWRQMKQDLNTSAAQAMLAVKKDITNHSDSSKILTACTQQCAKAFEDGNTDRCAAALAEVIRNLPADGNDKVLGTILADCAVRLEAFGNTRKEYLLLSIHTLSAAAETLGVSDLDGRERPGPGSPTATHC